MSRIGDIAKVEVHTAAKQYFDEVVDQYSTTLLYQAKLLAYQRKDDAVLRNHVDEAQEIVEQQRKQNRGRELQIVVGSSLFGAFVPGFVTELNNGNSGLLVIWTLTGFVGLFLVLWALRLR
jgi:uncharacterized membrane protein YeaQ/YmgE (transglycosylase-associated protein family)